MRHFRISLSLQVAFLALCALRPIRGADVVATLLENLAPEDEYLIVWVISADRKEELWLDDLFSTDHWRETAGSYPSTTLHAEKNRSFLIQFAIQHVPLCLVLDSNGREAGRIQIGDLGRESHRVLSSRLSDLLVAAEASRRYAEGADIRDGDSARLFWLGYFHWNRGERFKALRWFEEYSALPSTEGGADSELKSRALYRQGEYALEGGHSKKAATLFARALELTRDTEQSARCALARARSLRRLGQLDQAIRTIETQLRTRPSSRLDDRLLFSLGYLYMDLGDRGKARTFFAECTMSFPTSAYSRKSAHYLQELAASAPGRTTDEKR